MRICEPRAYYKGKSSREEDAMQNPLYDQSTRREASKKKDRDMLGLSNGFRGTLVEKHKEIEEL